MRGLKGRRRRYTVIESHLDKTHTYVIEEKPISFLGTPFRFRCTCATESLWVESFEYAQTLAEMHVDIIVLDVHIKQSRKTVLEGDGVV